jgi:hypothetical protein
MYRIIVGNFRRKTPLGKMSPLKHKEGLISEVLYKRSEGVQLGLHTRFVGLVRIQSYYSGSR